MFKLKVTNIGKLPKFLTEAGKLLQPGESVPCNRVDRGTRTDPSFRIEEGEFAAAAPAGKVKVGPQQYDEDDEDEKPAKKKVAVDEGPARLVDNKAQRRSVPLVAEGAAYDDSDDDSDDGWGGKDELDGEIPTADKVEDKGEGEGEKSAPAGFVDRKGFAGGGEGNGGGIER